MCPAIDENILYFYSLTPETNTRFNATINSSDLNYYLQLPLVYWSLYVEICSTNNSTFFENGYIPNNVISDSGSIVSCFRIDANNNWAKCRLHHIWSHSQTEFICDNSYITETGVN